MAFRRVFWDLKWVDSPMVRLKQSVRLWRDHTRVENLGMNCGQGCKGQSNSVIWFSRNAFRCSVAWSLVECRATDADGPCGLLTSAKLRMPLDVAWQ